MSGYGSSGHKSSSTLSPLAPPFTIDQSVPKFSFSSQSTGPLGDLPHQSNSGIADNWLHIHSPAENNQLMSSSLDTNFPSLGHNHIFPYAQASMTASSLPVAEAGPFYPKYPFPLDRSVDSSLPPSLDGSSCSPVLAGPWDGSSDGKKVEPSVVCASYGKKFKGKISIFGKGGSQGFSLSKENLGFWEGKSESFTNNDKMGLTISDDVGLLSSTKENSSGVLAYNVPDQLLHSGVEDNTGFLSYNMAKSCELQTGILKDTSLSHLSFSLVSMTDCDPLNPMTASCGTHQQVNLQSVEPAVSKSSSSLTLFNPGSYDDKSFRKGPTVFSWNIQEYAALPGYNQSGADGLKSGGQILKIGSKDVVEDKIDKREMSFNFSSESSSNNHKLENACLNQPNISTFTSGTDLPVRSSSEVSDQLNHAVDSPCWKGAPPSSSLFLSTVRTSEERSAVGLEVISSPKFSASVVNKENTNVEVTCSKTDICVGPSDVWDSMTCHVLRGIANNNLDLKAASSPLNSQANVGAIRLDNCPETSECFESDVGNLPPLELKTNDIVDLICNLSKLLCSSQRSALNTLKDKDYENLQLTVESLRTCLSARKMDDKLGCLYDCSKIAIPFKLIDRINDMEDRQLSLNDTQNLCSSRTHSCNGLGSEDNFCKLDTFSSKGVDSHCTKSSPTEVFQKHFRENVCSMEEDHPQTLVYKRLWIEAEAALCSMKYKLQCAQKHIEMEKWKDNSVKGSEDPTTMSQPVFEEKASASDPLKAPMLDLNRLWTQRQGISSNDDVLQNFSDVDRTNQVDLSPEDSVMARLRILQHQVEGSLNKTLAQGINILDNMSQRGNSLGFDKVHNVEIEDHSKKTVDLSLEHSDSVIARFRILRNQIEGSSSNITLGQSGNISDNFSPVKADLQSFYNVLNVEVEDHSKKMIDLDLCEEKNLWNYVSGRVENVHLGAGEMGEPLNFVETIGSDMLADHMPSSSHFYGTRKNDFPAFDWEHVFKDEVASNR